MKLHATLNMAHINIRREKAGDEDGDAAVDIKLTGELSPDDLTDLFSTEASHKKILAGLWDKDGEMTTSDLDTIRISREGKGCAISLETEFSDAMSFDSGDFNKITLKPKAGKRVEFAARLQLHPSSEEIGTLAGWLGYDLEVRVEQKQSELDLKPKEEAAPASDAHPSPQIEKQLGDLEKAGVVKGPFKTPEEIAAIRDAVERDDAAKSAATAH